MEIPKNKKIKVIDVFKKSISDKDGIAKQKARNDSLEKMYGKSARQPQGQPNDPEEFSKSEIKKRQKQKGEESHGIGKPESIESVQPVFMENRKKEIPAYKEHIRKKGKKSFGGFIAAVIVFAVLGGSVYAAFRILPKVEIKISTKKAVWNSADNSITSIIANPKIADIDVINHQIPSAIFSQPKKNFTGQWPATGKKYVEKKATGAVIIYNEYSSGDQILISGTRFQAPNGKIFKLTDRVVVPGAKIEGGKIVASSISAAVVADKAGEAYNIDPVGKLTIPGFQGTDKYAKFYGSSESPMSGGFIGQASYPTDNDIKSAKADAEAKIKTATEGYLYAQIISENFKPINGTEQFNITKEIINKDTDSSGNFSVYIEAEASIQSFKESSVVDLMTKLSHQGSAALDSDFMLNNYKIDYNDNVTTDAKNKLVIMPVNFTGNFRKPVNADDFKNKIFSKSQSDLKAFIFSTPNIEKADISFWPFWVNSVPSDPKQVNVTVE